MKADRRSLSNTGSSLTANLSFISISAQLLPPHLYQEALSCHAAGNEILRHFWASTGMDKATKHMRMIESLKKIRDENVKSLMIQASSLGTDCLGAMKMVMHAFDVFASFLLCKARKRLKLMLLLCVHFLNRC